MLLAWLLSAATTHALCRSLGKRGSFDDLLALFGFGVGVAPFATLVHDLISSALGAMGVINQQRYEYLLNQPTVWRILLLIQMSVYVIWVILLFSKAITVVYRTRPGFSFLLGISGFIVYQGFFFLLNR